MNIYQQKKKLSLYTRYIKSGVGFTLVEVLVAISILSLSILATFTAVSNNLRSSNFSEDQVVAYYLADEGIEFIRNRRDQNGIKNEQQISLGGSGWPWLSGIAQVIGDPCFGIACIADSPLNNLASCVTINNLPFCPYLRFDPSSGLYGYTPSWNLTRFKRFITVTPTSPTEATVSVTVTWVTNGVAKNYVVSEIMRAWE